MKYQPTTTNFSYHPAQNQDPFPIRTQQRPFLPPATHFSDAIHAQQMNPLLRLNPASQSVPDFMNLERLKSQHANHMVRISSYPQRSDFLYTNQGFKTSESGSNDQDREIDDNHSGQKQKNQMTINQKYVEPEKMSRSGKKSRFKGVSIAGHRWRATRGKVEIGMTFCVYYYYFLPFSLIIKLAQSRKIKLLFFGCRTNKQSLLVFKD